MTNDHAFLFPNGMQLFEYFSGESISLYHFYLWSHMLYNKFNKRQEVSNNHIFTAFRNPLSSVLFLNQFLLLKLFHYLNSLKLLESKLFTSMILVFSSTIEGMAYKPPLCFPMNNVGLKKKELLETKIHKDVK